MRRSQSSSEHAEAVSRRLATLSAELAAVRREQDDEVDPAHGHTRVRERPDRVTDPAPAPVEPRLPGRHASRRLRVGGLQLGPVHLAVVAVVAALAVGLAAWWAVRDQARAVPVAPAASERSDLAAPASPLAPVVPSAAPGAGGASGSPVPGGEALVNLNTADQAALEALPGVGPVTADAILAWRDGNGGFTSVDELLEVDGIGEATLADLAPLVTL